MKLNLTPQPSRCTFRLTAAGMVAAMITSCATPQGNPTTAAPTAKVSASWVRVRSNPPTWYPRGIDAGHPTDHYSGEWIYTDDTRGTRFFIPLHGLPPDRRKALIDEAFAARNPDKVRRVSNEESSRKLATSAGVLVAAPLLVAGTFLTGGMVPIMPQGTRVKP